MYLQFFNICTANVRDAGAEGRDGIVTKQEIVQQCN
jgi:hypothetical protein